MLLFVLGSHMAFEDAGGVIVSSACAEQCVCGSTRCFLDYHGLTATLGALSSAGYRRTVVVLSVCDAPTGYGAGVGGRKCLIHNNM